MVRPREITSYWLVCLHSLFLLACSTVITLQFKCHIWSVQEYKLQDYYCEVCCLFLLPVKVVNIWRFIIFTKPLQVKNCKVVPSDLLAQHTHSLVSDQVMFDGGTTIILFDPVDLNGIAHVLDLEFKYGSTGFSCTGKHNIVISSAKCGYISLCLTVLCVSLRTVNHCNQRTWHIDWWCAMLA